MQQCGRETDLTVRGTCSRPTTETVCLDYFMKALIEATEAQSYAARCCNRSAKAGRRQGKARQVNHPVMLIGLAGCGDLLSLVPASSDLSSCLACTAALSSMSVLKARRSHARVF